MSTGEAAPRFAPRPVDVSAIERELAALWREAAAGREGAPAMLRACMSNLVVFCADPEEARAAQEDLAAVAERHPSRAILLVAQGGPRDDALDASVSAVCHLTGPGRAICSEHVLVSAGRGALQALPSAVRSLLIGDLPTSLWWAAREPPLAGGALFGELASLADQVIYDSAGWQDPAAGVVETASWAEEAAEAALSDLAWRRLKPWRRALGQALDPARLPGALAGLAELELEHGPHGLPEAWLLVGWLAGRLGWRPERARLSPGSSVTWHFDGPAGPVHVTARRLAEGAPDLRALALRWRGGARPGQARFEAPAPDRISVSFGRGPTPELVLPVPPAPRAELLARQLPKLGRDLLFRDALALARRLAEALLP